MIDPSDLIERLKKAAAVMRADRPTLWTASPGMMDHRRVCQIADHSGCNKFQAVEAMEQAASALLASQEAQDRLRALAQVLVDREDRDDAAGGGEEIYYIRKEAMDLVRTLAGSPARETPVPSQAPEEPQR